MENCWFDYVHLSDDKRNELFARAYLNAYRSHYARRIDAKAAPYVNPIHGLLPEDPPLVEPAEDAPPSKRKVFERRRRSRIRNAGSISKARKAADALSVPYSFYCETLISHYAKSQWTYLPKLSQLYGKGSADIVSGRWQSYVRSHLVLPESGCSTISFVDYIKQIVYARRHPKFTLSHLLKNQYITSDAALALFGKRLVDEAESLI